MFRPVLRKTSPSLIARTRTTSITTRTLHTTPRALVKAGQDIPSVDGLYENSAGNKVDLVDEFSNADGYIVGVPGAFTGTCSSRHVPSYINHPRLKHAGKVFVVSVNDPFVMKAWGDQLDPAAQTGIRFVADPSATLTKALEVDWDGGAAIFGGIRSKRYALKVEDGKITEVHIEPDATGADVSMAEKVLG